MKTPKEILEDFKLKMGFRYLEGLEGLIDIIKYTQEETIKVTVQACVDNAEADVTLLGWLEENKEEYNFQVGQDYEVYIIKSSILEVADKLIKELE